MTIHIRFLKAQHGDAILVTNASTTGTTNILIDGGPPSAFKRKNAGDTQNGKLKVALDKLIENQQYIDLLILTHVDDDHIGGLISAFEHPNYLSKLAKIVIFNSGQLIYEHFNSETPSPNDIQGNFDGNPQTSIGQGITFEQHISTLNIWHRKLFLQNCCYQLAGLTIRFLSPDEDALKKLCNKWEKEQESPFTSASQTDYTYSYEKLINSDSFEQDTAISNGSSLSFILETGEQKKFIFLGDAYPEIVVAGLKKLGYSEQNPIQAELVKISHHGSKGNTNNELLKLIKTSQYVICTDGSKYGLPNKRTLARIHSINPNATILFNYPHLIDNIYNDEEKKSLGNKIQCLQGELSFV